MFVLVLAAGSFLVFVAVLACLFIAHTLESRETLRTRNIWITGPVALLSIEQAFDPIFARLWDAPILALQIMDASRSGVYPSRLQPIFQRAAASFPEIYDGCEFIDWLDFLQHERLLAFSGKKVAITPHGKEFLANRFVSNALLEAHSADKSTV